MFLLVPSFRPTLGLSSESPALSHSLLTTNYRSPSFVPLVAPPPPPPPAAPANAAMAPTASIHSQADDAKHLAEALATVNTQLGVLRRCLDGDLIMDALKAASTMLAGLRTSTLSPKQYYELYMAVFDALRHLSLYLHDAHQSGKHHLADLYELVQYAGNIVPRLYLMITVGSVYMSIEGAPVKEIMKDMMEMARGVQHPTRGLFLRHYSSGMTTDHLPVGKAASTMLAAIVSASLHCISIFRSPRTCNS
ncbi:hypothetical protein JCM10207_001610 [Rhodosporidiobolus poonsookiae]